MTRTQVWSYGGGVQSAAIAVLVSQGRLPDPDIIVMADTGRETRVTWEYLDDVVRPLLAPRIVDVVPHEAARVDLYDPKGRLLIPAYTDQGQGRLPTYCSSEWKRDPIQRWLRSRDVGDVDLWLGISVDEMHRAKASRLRWLVYRYPLLMDVPMRRSDCLQVVQDAGLPTPPRSACWMCPYRSDDQWRELRDGRPDEWRQAVDLEDQVRATNDRLTLHRGGRPLTQTDLDPKPRDVGLWDQDACDTGFCMT